MKIVGSQEIPGATGKFGFEVQNEAGGFTDGYSWRKEWSFNNKQTMIELNSKNLGSVDIKHHYFSPGPNKLT